jgi:hypothetical protein
MAKVDFPPFTNEKYNHKQYLLPFNSKINNVVQVDSVLNLPDNPKNPFDDMTYHICYELMKVKFEGINVAGIEITFNDLKYCKTWEEKRDRHIHRIDFNFSKNGIVCEGYFNFGWGIEIGIDKQKLEVHDENDMVYYKYIGKDWKRDKNSFFNGTSEQTEDMYISYCLESNEGKDSNNFIPYDKFGTIAGRSAETISKLNLPLVLNKEVCLNDFCQFLINVHEYIVLF